jgi:hypothetical protein
VVATKNGRDRPHEAVPAAGRHQRRGLHDLAFALSVSDCSIALGLLPSSSAHELGSTAPMTPIHKFLARSNKKFL